MPPTDAITSFLRVRLGGATLALPALMVREILRAVAITPLPGTHSIIEGAVNVRGRLVPVIDLRERLSFPPKPLDPDEFLVVLQTAGRSLAIRVEAIDDLVDVNAADVGSPADLSPALVGLAGVIAREDGVLVMYDPAAFVSQAETEAIDSALAALA